MKYYIIVGEASGDLHASNLMKALLKKDKSADIRFWGGELMEQAGGTLVKHYKDLAFMGFLEVIMNLGTILKNLSFCKNDIQDFQPDCIIFVDYPGFNLRIAKWAKTMGYATHYYISPQIWAWKESRIRAIKRDVDKMYVILPFEKSFYEDKHHMKVDFVGHPLIDAITHRKPVDKNAFKQQHNLNNLPIIALLPGSRKQEISKMLKVMLNIVDAFPNHQFVIAGAPSQDQSFYSKFLGNRNVKLIMNQTYDLLDLSEAAIVTSGTATLETALLKVPEVVCYKSSWLSYQIGKRLVKLKFISLVNLIMNREVVKELIQNEFTPNQLQHELQQLVDTEYRSKLISDYDLLENSLGGPGASEKVAQLIADSVKQTAQ